MHPKGASRFSPLILFLAASSAALSVGVRAASHSADHGEGRLGAYQLETYQASASAVRLQPMTPALPKREVAPDFTGRVWAVDRLPSLATLVMPGPRPDSGPDRTGEGSTSRNAISVQFS